MAMFVCWDYLALIKHAVWACHLKAGKPPKSWPWPWTHSLLPVRFCGPRCSQAWLKLSTCYSSSGLLPLYHWGRSLSKAKNKGKKKSLSPIPFPRQLWSPSYRLVPDNREVGTAGKVLGDGNGGVKIEDNVPPASWNPTNKQLNRNGLYTQSPYNTNFT